MRGHPVVRGHPGVRVDPGVMRRPGVRGHPGVKEHPGLRGHLDSLHDKPPGARQTYQVKIELEPAETCRTPQPML